MKLTYIKDVATLSLDENKCIGCGMCALVCPHRVFAMSGKKAGITGKNRCMECSAC